MILLFLLPNLKNLPNFDNNNSKYLKVKSNSSYKGHAGLCTLNVQSAFLPMSILVARICHTLSLMHSKLSTIYQPFIGHSSGQSWYAIRKLMPGKNCIKNAKKRRFFYFLKMEKFFWNLIFSLTMHHSTVWKRYFSHKK